MQAIVHAADIQDRDGGVLLMGTLFGLYPFLLKLYADSGYQGAKFQNGLKAVCGHVNLEIVKRSDLHNLSSCHNDGSSSAPSVGSTAVDGSPRIGSASTEMRSRSCAGPPSALCSENSANAQDDPGWTHMGRFSSSVILPSHPRCSCLLRIRGSSPFAPCGNDDRINSHSVGQYPPIP
jgi:hypothetical protein